MRISDSDLMIMAKTIWGEARGESHNGQVAVAWVIRNRAERGGWWGNTIREVCLKDQQFSCWNHNDCNRAQIDSLSPNDPQLSNMKSIARGVVENSSPPDPTYGSTIYYAYNVIDTPPHCRGKRPVATIGGHHFFNNID